MKIDKYLACFLALFFLMVSAMPTEATQYPSNGVLKWKGQTWNVRSEYGEPGPNYFSSSGAWIDNQNRMHLSVVKKNGKWYCTEIDSRDKFKYGTFTCEIASSVFTYPRNSICGMFTYLDDSQELDIEMTRWGETSGNNIWYSVQPYSIKGNNKGFTSPSGVTGENTIHVIDWKPNYVRFTSKTSTGKILADFNYTNVAGIPKNPEYLIFNVWLQGAPSDGKNIDFIISDFSYQPYLTNGK
jgi:hypothetical protein